MKLHKTFILFMVAAAISLGSCQKDPQKEVEKGDWNKEKRIISLSFERQAGDASISINADDASRGTIEVTIVNPDLSEPLLIKKMEISYGGHGFGRGRPDARLRRDDQYGRNYRYRRNGGGNSGLYGLRQSAG